MRRAFSLLLIGAALALVSLPAAGQSLSLPFTIAKPAGDGPFPAVVMLHDCSGLGPGSSGAPWRWSSLLVARGYVTIWPDSFTQRGHPGGVCTDATPPRVVSRERAADAHQALAYLRTLPYVDGRRIGVMGGSHGGSATLASIVEWADGAVPGTPGFAAAIAFYPACGQSFGAWRVTRAPTPGKPITGTSGVFKPVGPLLILTGELDDWTPAEPCRRLAEASQAAGLPVEIKIYPGAHHSFDSLAPVRFIAGRINQNSPTGLGATTGGNAEAWKDAREQVLTFFEKHLAK